MITLLTLSVAAALVLLVVSVSEAGGVPVSLSSTYYDLGEGGWMFQALMTAVALTLLPVWMGLSSEGCRWMAFLACASLLFVAAAPAFKIEMEGKVHYSAAIICCMCAVLWQMLEGLWNVTLCFAWTGGILSLIWKKQWCWFIECAVMGSLIVNLWRLVC